MTSNGRDSSGEIGEARRSASSPSVARATSNPNRRSAFWAMRALMSLSSAMSARRAGADPGEGRAVGAAAGGESHAARSNSERARTGFTSQPSKPLSAVSPKARRSNGENRRRLRRTPAARAA